MLDLRHFARTIAMMIPAIVLAAGKSTRMGRPKATLPLACATPFCRESCAPFTTPASSDVVVVVGHGADDDDRQSVAGRRRSPASSSIPDYESGQFSSLLKGLDAVDTPGVAGSAGHAGRRAAGERADTVRAVVDRYDATHAPIVRPTRGAEHGHPVLIDRSLFDTLRRADPRVGAKAIVRAHASPEGDVVVDDDGAFLDIDTMEEYQRLIVEKHL